MSNNQTVLVTGGAGFIGTHICLELLEQGYKVVVVDNLYNSCEAALERVEKITGKKLVYIWADVTDFNAMDSLMESYKFDAVIHLAALKAVGESVDFPLRYYDNNISGVLSILKAMSKNGVRSFIFSSSATVYGGQTRSPITEDAPLSVQSPYGSTKLMTENILRDLFKADDTWKITILRYFNPVGAHKSALIGEDPNDIPNNLMPIINRVASGRLLELSVFGNDYPTHDGTGVRDYIHVTDLALGHIAALKKLAEPGIYTYNLGTGRGYSVLEVIKAFEKASGKKIPYRIAPRRTGDIATAFANPEKARQELGWAAKHSLDEMCMSAWQFSKRNPLGYKK